MGVPAEGITISGERTEGASAAAHNTPAHCGGRMKRTPLYDTHVALGAKMVPFAGYEMPVQFKAGVMAEHLQTRQQAGLFDVSHMGPIRIEGPDPAAALEGLMPQALIELPVGRQRYGFLTNEAGGIIDDLMVAKVDKTRLHLVVNAGKKDEVLAHLQAGMPEHDVAPVDDVALLALQGPAAEAALSMIIPYCAAMRFMDYRRFDSPYGPLDVARSGYTGEDGFEIMFGADQAEAMAEALLALESVAPIGLGARDSLRLEAGLCLYGQDIDMETSPVEAGLIWAIQKARRPGGARAGGFPGADVILRQLEEGPARRRVGLKPEGRAPMRAGVFLFAEDGAEVGAVTSGGFGPSVGGPVAMGYVDARHTAAGTALLGEVRGKKLPVTVVDLPFVPANFKR